MRRTLATLAIAGLTFGVVADAGADGTSATITGSVGENVSTTDAYDGRHLRYVGDPAPAGYADYYQHGEHVLTTSPEDGPVPKAGPTRPEERRARKEGVSTCQTRWSPE